MKPPIIRTFQIVAYPTCRLIAELLGRRAVDLGAEDLVAGRKYVLVPNHQSYLDTSIIPSCLPFQVLWRLAPVRCLLLNEAFDTWWLRPLAVIAGCFPARTHASYRYGLDMAAAVLASGQSLMIFPEGRRSLRSESKPHRGVALIADWPEVELIPVHIEWRRSGRWRRSFHVVIGKPFSGAGMNSREIMTRVYQLE